MRIPTATYRLQFHKDFRFADAKELIDYLYDLGISDVYASPIFKARAGSMHGYDVVDHSQLDPALGGEEDFAAFTSALKARGLGLTLDIVPNHMGISDTANTWWMDVLENGPSSSYASYFDIDWQPVNPHLENKVLLPILEDQYGNVLEDGKLRLTYEDGAFFIYFHDTKLPIAPGTYGAILGRPLDPLTETLGKDNERVLELQSILTAISHLPLVASIGLFNLARGSTAWPELANMAGPAFYDLTRLASGNPEMAHDVFLTNKQNVVHWINRYITELLRIEELIEGDDPEALFRTLAETQIERDTFLNSPPKREDPGLPSDLPSPTQSFVNLLAGGMWADRAKEMNAALEEQARQRQREDRLRRRE